MHPLDGRLRERAEAASLRLDNSLRDRLLIYYDLLYRWNRTINLTALADPDEAIDRLLLEPVAAARLLPSSARLMDLGSGGGSPAIPLALALDVSQVVMVESKARKAAFLREAMRAVGLNGTVEAERFEVLAASGQYAAAFDVVSMRAVRMDEDALAVAARFLAPNGRIALFVSLGAVVAVSKDLKIEERSQLIGKTELLLAALPRST